MNISDIFYTTRFLRAYKKMSPELKAHMQECEVWFRTDCFDPRLKTHKLSGPWRGSWAFSITKKHRVIFIFNPEGAVVFIATGDHNLYR